MSVGCRLRTPTPRGDSHGRRNVASLGHSAARGLWLGRWPGAGLWPGAAGSPTAPPRPGCGAVTACTRRALRVAQVDSQVEAGAQSESDPAPAARGFAALAPPAHGPTSAGTRSRRFRLLVTNSESVSAEPGAGDLKDCCCAGATGSRQTPRPSDLGVFKRSREIPGPVTPVTSSLRHEAPSRQDSGPSMGQCRSAESGHGLSR